MQKSNFKERAKGFIVGTLVMTMLFGGVMAVSAQTLSRNITYGVGVILNGQQVNFDHDSRPFVMDGRTFLPLRTLGELLDLPVDFDPVGNNAILGTAVARRGTPVSELFFDGSGGGGRVRTRDEVLMGGNNYGDVVYFTFNMRGIGGFAGVAQSASLNLNRNYTWLTGSFGREDGTLPVGATVNIYADDRLVETFVQEATALPTEFRLFVEDVRLIRVDITYAFPRHPGGTLTYALTGFAE